MSDRMKDYMDSVGEVWTDLLNPRIAALGRRSDWRTVETSRIEDLGTLVGLTDVELDASIFLTPEGQPDTEAMRRMVRDAVDHNAARGTENRISEFLKGLNLTLQVFPLYTRDGLRFTRQLIPGQGYWLSRQSDLVVTLDRAFGTDGRVLDRNLWNYLYNNIEKNRPLSAPVRYDFKLPALVGRDLAVHANAATGLRFKKTDKWQPEVNDSGTPLPYTMDWTPVPIRADSGLTALEPKGQPTQMRAVFSSEPVLDVDTLDQVMGHTLTVTVFRKNASRQSHYVYAATLPETLDLPWDIRSFYLFNASGEAFYTSTFNPVQKFAGFSLTSEVMLPRRQDVVIAAPVVSVAKTTYIDATLSTLDWTWTKVDGETEAGVATLHAYEVSTDGTTWTQVGFATAEDPAFRTQGTPGAEETLHVRGLTSEGTVGTVGTFTATYANP